MRTARSIRLQQPGVTRSLNGERPWECADDAKDAEATLVARTGRHRTVHDDRDALLPAQGGGEGTGSLLLGQLRHVRVHGRGTATRSSSATFVSRMEFNCFDYFS